MGKIDEEDYKDVIRDFVKYMNDWIASNCEEIRYNEKLSELNVEFKKANAGIVNKLTELETTNKTLNAVKDNFIDLLGDYDISISEIMGD